MMRSGFNIFVVDDANREAFEFCRGVASLESGSAGLHALVGERGSGKTHLLYAIVDEIRNASSPPAIAYVNPSLIPDELRRLIDDPSPVDLVEQAILLVDDIDRFEEDLEVLGDIVRIFVENDHLVLFTSGVHPGRLHDLPHGLGPLLEKTRAHEIESGDMQRSVALIEQRVRMETDEVLARQAKEIADLQARLDSSYARPQRSLGADEETKKARSDARGMLERAQRLMEELEQSRSEFVKAQGNRQEQLAEIEKLESVFAGTVSEAVEEEKTAPIGPDAEHAEGLRVELEVVQKEHDALEIEQSRLEESLVRAHSERDTTKRLFESAQREIEELRRDLDKEKRDGEERLEAERGVADELRKSLGASRAELEGHIGAQRLATDELMSLQSQLSDGAGLLERLMELFRVSHEEPEVLKEHEPERGGEIPIPTDVKSKEESHLPEADVSIYRAAFGETADSSLPKTPALHHVEELRATNDPYEDGYDFEESDDEDVDSSESRNKTA